MLLPQMKNRILIIIVDYPMINFKILFMKNFRYIYLIAPLLVLLLSCESDNEKYSGTPVGNQQFETIEGTISTNITAAMRNQAIPFRVSIPRTFKDTVSIEVATLNLSGGRTRVSVDILPGDTEATDEIPCAGGLLYDTTVNLSMTGIALKTVESGKHYLIKSNVITLQTGDTSVPPSDNSRLSVRFTWPEPASSLNNIRLTIVRPDNVNNTPILDAGVRDYAILTTVTNVNALNKYSSQPGEYIFKINAVRLIDSPVNLPYRFVVRFPDGTSRLIQGVYENLTTTSPQKIVLKAVKTVNPATNIATFVVTEFP